MHQCLYVFISLCPHYNLVIVYILVLITLAFTLMITFVFQSCFDVLCISYFDYMSRYIFLLKLMFILVQLVSYTWFVSSGALLLMCTHYMYLYNLVLWLLYLHLYSLFCIYFYLASCICKFCQNYLIYMLYPWVTYFICYILIFGLNSCFRYVCTLLVLTKHTYTLKLV